MVATRGTPLQGDRSAHDMTDATKHASDIEDATPLYHWTEAQILALASAVSDLNGLADVSIEGPVEGDLLVYDDLTEDWLNMSAGVAGLSEVGHQHVEDDITDLGSYAALVHLHVESDISDFGTYSEVGHQHVEADITDLATDDHDHSGDVGDGGQLDWDNIWSDAVHNHSNDAEGGIFDAALLGSSAASDGYVLTADGIGGAAWEELTPGASALDDLSDVNAPAPNADDVLTWDGAEWIAAALSAGASALSDLTDVNVTAPNDGDVLTWVTDEWVAAVAAAGAGDASDLTFTPSTVSDWDGSVDPGNADDAFDQLAERIQWLSASQLSMLTSSAIGPSWHAAGVLAIAEDIGERWVMPDSGTIKEIIIAVAINGTASDTIVDIHKNGTTIFTTQGNRPTIAHDNDDNYDSGIPDVVSFSRFDTFTADIDGVAAGASDLRIMMILNAASYQSQTVFLADAIDLVIGSTTSAVSDLQYPFDGAFYHVDEVADTPGIDLIVDFENVTGFNHVSVKGVYAGSATHSIAVQLYNWTETRWDTYHGMQTGKEDVSTADGYIMDDVSFLVPDDAEYIGTGGDAGNVRVRFCHTMSGNASHDLYIDGVQLIYNPTLPSFDDSNAIHDNVANEISAIEEKTVPVDADMIIIEDSEAANVKKMVQIGNLPSGGSGGASIIEIQVFT